MFEPQREYLDSELLTALQRGDKRTVERFLSQEASAAIDLPDADNVDADQAGRRSWRGVTVGGNSALHIAADFGHLELTGLICARDSSLLTACNVAGETPLHCAARAGADRIVSLFISVANPLEAVLHARDREGKTALYAAAQEGHAAAARVLMSEDPGLAAIVDEKGVSPLYVAVLSGSLQVVQILIRSHADGGDTPEASYAGPNGQTALHAAAMIESPIGTAANLGVVPTAAVGPPHAVPTATVEVNYIKPNTKFIFTYNYNCSTVTTTYNHTAPSSSYLVMDLINSPKAAAIFSK